MEIEAMGIQERKEREKERRRQQIMVAAKRVFPTGVLINPRWRTLPRKPNSARARFTSILRIKKNFTPPFPSVYFSISLIRVEHVNEEKDAGPEEKLKSLMDAMYDVYEFDPLIIINMFHLQSSETLKNLSPPLMSEIKDLSRKSLGSIAKIFKEGVEKGIFVDRHPLALADTFWSLFSGVVLWLTSKKIIDERKDYLKQTLDVAFEVFGRGIKETPSD